MRKNVIPIRRNSQDDLTKLYLHLLNVALSDADASTAARCGQTLSTFKELPSRHCQRASEAVSSVRQLFGDGASSK